MICLVFGLISNLRVFLCPYKHVTLSQQVAMSTLQPTQHSLIHRAISLDDHDAWQLLSDKYSRFIYYILHQFEIDQNDLDDVHQKVMVILMRDLKNYDRSRARFRNWLSMVIRSTCLMHYREKNSLEARQIRIENELINTDNAQTHVIDQYIEKEWKKYVMSLAMDLVKQSYSEDSIRTFELGLQGMSADEISAITGETPNAIYSKRKRLKKSLMEAIKSVIEEIEL